MAPRGIAALLGSCKTPKTPPEELLSVEALGAGLSAIGAPRLEWERFITIRRGG